MKIESSETIFFKKQAKKALDEEIREQKREHDELQDGYDKWKEEERHVTRTKDKAKRKIEDAKTEMKKIRKLYDLQ